MLNGKPSALRAGLTLRRPKPGNWALRTLCRAWRRDPDLITAGRGGRCAAGNVGRFMGSGLHGRSDVVAAGHRRADHGARVRPGRRG
jgi:hypothetical protein